MDEKQYIPKSVLKNTKTNEPPKDKSPIPQRQLTSEEIKKVEKHSRKLISDVEKT